MKFYSNADVRFLTVKIRFFEKLYRIFKQVVFIPK